jgi:hypothetical protein
MVVIDYKRGLRYFRKISPQKDFFDRGMASISIVKEGNDRCSIQKEIAGVPFTKEQQLFYSKRE